MEAKSIVDALREKTWDEGASVVAVWCQVLTDRRKFAESILEARGDSPIVPLVVRGNHFQSANALMSDLRAVIDLERESFQFSDDQLVDSSRPLVILLLARTTFILPAISSPVVLPDWFPRSPGSSVDVQIGDLEHEATVSIQCDESKVEDVARLLYEVDVALLDRLCERHQEDRHHTTGLCSLLLRQDQKETWEGLQMSCRRFLDQVTTPTAYRPSARGSTFVSRIVAYVNSHSPDALSRIAKHLATGLGDIALRGTEVESLFAVLMRPTSRPSTDEERATRALTVTIYAAYQLTTAAAHADDYPPFPVVLLRSCSYDIRRVLDRFVTALSP